MENRYLNKLQQQQSPRPFSNDVLSALDHVWMLCLTWDQQLKRHGTRKHLIQLDDDRLRDIGITRAQRDSELRKFFWQA